MASLKIAAGGQWVPLAPTTYVWDINSSTTGSLNINRLAGYPGDSSKFLNGSGSWSIPSITLTGSVTGSGSLDSPVSTSLYGDQSITGILSFNWALGTPDFKIRNLSGGTISKFSIGHSTHNWLFNVQSSNSSPYIAFTYVIQAGGLGGRLTDTPFYIAQDSSDATRFVVATDGNMSWGASGDQYIYYGRNSPTVKVMEKTTQSGTTMFRRDCLAYNNGGYTSYYNSLSGSEEFGWGKISTSGVMTKLFGHNNSASTFFMLTGLKLYGELDADSYNITTTGVISARTGTVKANNFDSHNSVNINMAKTVEWWVSGSPVCYINPLTTSRTYSGSGFYNALYSTVFETKASGETSGIIMNGDYMQFYNPMDVMGFIFSDEDAPLTSYVCYINSSGILVSSSSETKYSIRKKKPKDYLERLKKLDVYSYGKIYKDEDGDSEQKKKRKDKKRKTLHTGLIAEDVLELFDNATNIKKELDLSGTGEEIVDLPESLAINYNVLICYVIMAIKELDSKVMKILKKESI